MTSSAAPLRALVPGPAATAADAAAPVRLQTVGEGSREGASRGTARIAVVIPIFNDWNCARKLLPLLDGALAGTRGEICVLFVDDGSGTPAPADLVAAPPGSIREVRVLRLRQNLGHQRAIALGLYWVNQRLPADATIVMDGDGEDSPDSIPALLKALDDSGGREAVFAARAKRLEKPVFRFFYQVYRLVHRVLTGIPVKIGNFSVIPKSSADRLMVSSDLWNHYAAAVVRSKLPLRSIPIPRARRLDGSSRMNFFGLVTHGISAISVYSDTVGVRLLVAATGFLLLSIALAAGVLYATFAIPQIVPQWVRLPAGLLAVMCLQATMLSLVLVLPVIGARSHAGFIPLRDSEYYILEQTRIW